MVGTIRFEELTEQIPYETRGFHVNISNQLDLFTLLLTPIY